MKFKLFLFVIFLFHSLPAQFSSLWTKVDAIKSPFIYAAYFKDDFVYAGSDSLFISSDKGNTWKSILSGQNKLTDIQAIIKTNFHLYVGTSSEGILRSSDDGISWESFNNGLSSWAKRVTCFLQKGDTLYIGTDGGGVYYTNLKSATGWIEYNENLPSLYAWTINSMCYSGNNLIISAGHSGFYYMCSPGSPGWIEKTIDGSIQFITPNDFLSVGDTVYAGVSKSIYKSTNNGNTWDSVGIRAIPVNVVSFAQDKNRIYAGLSRDQDFFIWYSDDGGFSWNSDSHELTELNKLYVYDNKIWVTTFAGLWYKSLEPSSMPSIKVSNNFTLEQNFPNPFNPATRIKYSLRESAFVNLIIYDVLGREVTKLINEFRQAGSYTITFEASDLASGVYFYRLIVGNNSLIKKMVLVR